MKKILILLAICFTMLQAYQYDIYDINGKNRGTFTGIPNKHTLAKFITENHGSLLVKRTHPNSGNFIKSINASQISSLVEKQIDLTIDSLHDENWLEVEKNEIVKICLDTHVLAWETSLKSNIFNDSCLAIQAPILIGTEAINVYFSDADSSFKINLAVGMKYLDFQDKNVLLGYNVLNKHAGLSELDVEFDPERMASITGTFLVDKYPITNCEFTQLMWDSIPDKTTYTHPSFKMIQEEWISRKKNGKHNEKCITHDTAATTVFLYQSMQYANARSIREGLKPYYIFSKTEKDKNTILYDKKFNIAGYIIGYFDFIEHEDEFIMVKVDKTSDGYRLPYYDEWMMLARGGEKNKKAPWGDSTATFKDASEFAKFKSIKGRDFYLSEKEIELSEQVGQLRPNGYGLYDIFGLVEEHVLLERARFFTSSYGIHYFNLNFPSCFKGGQYLVSENHILGVSNIIPYWKHFNYGYYDYGYRSVPGGFRLIRNIGNNAKWTYLKSK